MTIQSDVLKNSGNKSRWNSKNVLVSPRKSRKEKQRKDNRGNKHKTNNKMTDLSSKYQ